jgi:hypothetical protein
MKKKNLLLLTVLLFVFNLKTEAQKLKPIDILSSTEKIETIVKLSEKQKKTINKALQTRKTSINESDREELKDSINNIYIKKLYKTLTTIQEKKIIEAQINPNDVKRIAKTYYQKRIAGKGFPNYYEKKIKDSLKRYQYNILISNAKHTYDHVKKTKTRTRILEKRQKWLSKHFNILKDVQKTWTRVNKQIGLDESQKQIFIDYHLYVYLRKNQEKEDVESIQTINDLIKKSNTEDLIIALANNESKKTLSRIKFRENDSIIQYDAKKELDSIFLKDFKTKTTSFKKLIDPTSSPVEKSKYREKIKAELKLKRNESKEKKNDNLYAELTKNAKAAGLEPARVKKLIALIKKKEKDMITFRTSKKDKSTFSVSEIETQKTKKEILSDFSKDIVNLVSKKEFSDIFANQLKPPVLKKVEKEFKKKKKESIYVELTKKGKAAGLDSVRVKKLIALIKKKEKDMISFQASKKDKSSVNILEIETQKSKKEIIKDFSKDVANLVSKKEFGAILGDQLKPQALKKAKKDFKQVLDNYELNEEQQKEVNKKIKLYYLNEINAETY